MATELSSETEAVIRDLLSTGAYPDRAAVLEDAVGLLARRRELRRLVEEGARSGLSLSDTDVFSEIEAVIERTGRERAGSGR